MSVSCGAVDVEGVWSYGFVLADLGVDEAGDDR